MIEFAIARTFAQDRSPNDLTEEERWLKDLLLAKVGEMLWREDRNGTRSGR